MDERQQPVKIIKAYDHDWHEEDHVTNHFDRRGQGCVNAYATGQHGIVHHDTRETVDHDRVEESAK